MENVLDLYHRPYDEARPVVCMDETPRQLTGQTREPIAAAPGRAAREDYEYERCGVCNVFMASEPLAGRRFTKVTGSRTRVQWSRFVQEIAEAYPDAQRITHRDGQPEHPHGRRTLRNLPTSAGQSLMGPV